MEKDKRRALRRKRTFKKARKRYQIGSDIWQAEGWNKLKSVHYFHKYNLSCNCDLCRSKTRDITKGYRPPISDVRKQLALEVDMQELNICQSHKLFR